MKVVHSKEEPLIENSIIYQPNYLSSEIDQKIQTYLESFPFSQVEYHKYGEIRKTPRLTYCYGQFNNEPKASYRGVEFSTEPIPDWLNQLKEPIEKYLGVTFNAVLMNKYLTGENHINWHQDDEQFLEHHTIGSLSFGQERPFQYRYQEKGQIHEISLKSGSLLIFSNGLWHSVPKRANIHQVRYNITFRKVNSNLGIGNYYYYNRGSK